MDTGSAIKGKYRFDFAVFDRNFAKQLGTNYWDVYLVKLGNGKWKKFHCKRKKKCFILSALFLTIYNSLFSSDLGLFSANVLKSLC